jgi:hypothetical protein
MDHFLFGLLRWTWDLNGAHQPDRGAELLKLIIARSMVECPIHSESNAAGHWILTSRALDINAEGVIGTCLTLFPRAPYSGRSVV